MRTEAMNRGVPGEPRPRRSAAEPTGRPSVGWRRRAATALLALLLALVASALRAMPAPATPSASAPASHPLVYGGSASFPPFEYLDAHGQPAGFNIELIRALSARVHQPIVIRLGAWPAMVEAFRHGDIDILALPESDASPGQFALLGRIWTLQEGLIFFHDRTPHAERVEQLDGRRILIAGGTPPSSLQAMLTAAQRRHLRVARTPLEALTLAQREPSFTILGDTLPFRYAAAQHALPSPLVVPVTLRSYRLAVHPGREAAFAWVNDGLTAFRADGTFNRLAERFLSLPGPAEPEHPAVRDLLVLLAVILLFVAIALAGTRSMRRQISAHHTRLALTVEEKARLSQALQTSHDRYRLLIESVQDYAIFMLTPQGCVTSWNTGAQRVLQYRQDEALGLPLARFYTPEEAEADQPGLALTLSARAGRFDCEGWRVRRDGSRFWATMVLTPLFDEDGGVRGYSCITRDVTERRRAEFQLKFQARVLSQVHEPIVGIDSDGRVTYWNSGAELLYRLLSADALGKRLSDLYTLRWIRPEDEARAKATFAATGSWMGEQIHRLQSGEEIYVESFISLLTDDHGRPIGSLAAARDVTERRRARESLQARVRQQAAVAELSQQALAEADFGALLDAAVQTVVRMLEVDCAKIFELLPGEDALVMRTGTGWQQGLVGHARLRVGNESQAGYTLQIDEPLIVLDLASDTRFADHDLLATHGVVSGVSVIIRTPERPYGVLSVHSRTSRTFTTDDVHFLEAVANVLGVSRQRIRAESALRESEASHRLLMERASDGIIIGDTGGRIVSANSLACEMLGCTEAELQTLGVTEVLASDGPASASLRLTRLATGQTSLSEQQLRRRNGTTLPVEISAKRLEDGRLQAFIRDITERKRAGEEIMRALSLLSATLEATTDGILTVDSQSRITSFNRRFVDMWEVPEDSVAAHDAGTVIQFAATRLKNPEALLAQTESLGAHPEAEASGLLELRDGRTFEVASRPQRLGTTWVGRVWSFRNITERLRLEAQVQHAQKLESLGVLAGGIAHDFNNLLLGVLGHAGLARMELADDSPIQARLAQIELTAQRAAELTNQMLAYSGKGRFVIQPVDLSHLVDEMAHLLHSVISKKAELRFDFADALPAVNGDVSQVRQIVMNLITNASDALGEQNGSITIRTGLIGVDPQYLADTYVNESLPEGPYVFVEVSDTGCGMDAATRARIFDPFFTTKFTGRGLGLAAVLGIVRGHHGAIKVYSEPGMGTTFKVLLPAAVGAAQAVSAPAPARETWHSGGLVLVVDDEEGVRTVAQGVLERCGFNVIEASDGREGVDVFREHAAEIRAVLLDMTMPRMSGVEALREIRRIRRDVPVILSSGYSEADAIDHFRFGGEELAGFIQKPYAAAGLVDKLRQALEDCEAV